MDIYIMLIGLAIALLILFYLKKLKQLKKYIYNISSIEHDSKTRYYIVYEQKHGVFTDTRILSKIHSFFLPKHHVEILSTLYNNEEEALSSLDRFKREIKHLSLERK